MSGSKHGNGNTSREERRKSRKIKTTRSVETQTEENSFCLCFIPEYKAQLDEEQELDPRIRLMLDQLHVLTEGKVTCVVRNFEKKPKWTAKQRWKMSGNFRSLTFIIPWTKLHPPCLIGAFSHAILLSPA